MTLMPIDADSQMNHGRLVVIVLRSKVLDRDHSRTR